MKHETIFWGIIGFVVFVIGYLWYNPSIMKEPKKEEKIAIMGLV